MAHLDGAGTESYDTRELAWELQQPKPDQQRIKMFLENEADLEAALRLANIKATDLAKKPALKPLQLEKHLHPQAQV